jgi:hypothetical protein
LAAFDPPEGEGVAAAGLEEELSFDDDDDPLEEDPLDDETLSAAEEDLRLSVR